MCNEKIRERVTRINELHCLGNNSIIPGQRTWKNKDKNKYTYPGVMQFRDIVHVAIAAVTPTEELVKQYPNLLSDPQAFANQPHRYTKFVEHNLRASLEAELNNDPQISNCFVERLYELLMIRHGLDPTNESQKEWFKGQMAIAYEVALTLRGEIIGEASEIIDPRLLHLTELQEINKKGDPFTLLRNVFLAKEKAKKLRAEAIHMLALQDAALKIILHQAQENGTLNRINEIIDHAFGKNNQEGKIGAVQQKIVFCVHQKETLLPLFVAETTEEIESYIDENNIDPNTVIIAWHPFPYRIMTIGDEQIECTFTSRPKSNVSALQKYILKNGRETPRDINGTKIIVRDANDAAQIIAQLHKALSQAGLNPQFNTDPKEYTNYLFETEISYQYTNQQGVRETVHVKLPKSTTEPTNPHSSWSASTSEIFQCDVEVTIDGKRKKFELRIVTQKHELKDKWASGCAHATYVNRKRWKNLTTNEETKKGYNPDNLFSRVLPNAYLEELNRIDSQANRSGMPRRRIIDLAEPKTAQRLEQAMARKIHRQNQRKLAAQRCKSLQESAT